MSLPQAIPYQGSKRRLASLILQYVPDGAKRLVEPFAGSAAVSLASLAAGKSKSVWINDLNGPLMDLWTKVMEEPDQLADEYSSLWERQRPDPRGFYDSVRASFNRQHRPAHFLYLLARCVKASVRYNASGDFNQSPDNRRLGAKPGTMRSRLRLASRLLRERCHITSGDYREVLQSVSSADVVYMDPPYQGVSRKRDCRYVAGLTIEEFLDDLSDLTARGIPFILSYDGRTGSAVFGVSLPPELKLCKLEVACGRSSQATLLGREHETFESLYVSQALLPSGASQSERLSVSDVGHFTLPLQQQR